MGSSESTGIELTVTVTYGTEIVHNETYLIDYIEPRWERFDLTFSEHSSCDELLSVLRHMAVEMGLEEDSIAVRTLYDALSDILGNAVRRIVRNKGSHGRIS